MWTEKYSPRSLREVVGQKNLYQLEQWFKTWKPGSPAALIWGPAGSGKTSSIYALAREHNLQVIEVNASDHRNAEEIEMKVGSASRQASLFSKGKIILVDEADGLAGREDRGGVGALARVVKDSKFPIAITTNNAYDQKLHELRSRCLLIEFKKIPSSFVGRRLENISRSENMKISDTVLKMIASHAGGDMRSAITDLQTVAFGKEEVSEADLDALGYREQERNIFEVIRIIMKSSSLRSALDAIQNSEKDPDEIFWWLEQNIAAEYEDPEEVSRAFDLLSKADIFSSRVFSRQNFAFKRYAAEMMASVCTAKKRRYEKFTPYKPPERLLRYGRTKGSRALAKHASEKAAAALHVSTNKLKVHYSPFFKIMNREHLLSLQDAAKLEHEELEAITS